MSTDTPRLGLVKPAYPETADIDVINDNMDVIDLAVGVSIVNTVSQITDPYNGQFAYELTNHDLRFFINGEWLLVAAGDQTSGNPDRIRLPAGSLSNLNDKTNSFQIGPDTGINMAFDQNEIQARSNGAASVLYLNEQGGTVEIGPASEITISSKGIKSDNMDSPEDFNGDNISVAATSYTSGSPNVEVTCLAPPSGKVLVLVSGRMSVANANGTGYISYLCKKADGSGPDVVTPGGSGNTIQNKAGSTNDNNNLTSTIPDVVKGLTPGENYRFTVQHRKNAGGDTVNIDFRKIIVCPQL